MYRRAANPNCVRRRDAGGDCEKQDEKQRMGDRAKVRGERTDRAFISTHAKEPDLWEF